MDIDEVLIVALIVSPWLVGGYFDYRTKIKALETKFSDSEKSNLMEENKSIRHRLEVLEAIVTDKGYEVNDKISRIK